MVVAFSIFGALFLTVYTVTKFIKIGIDAEAVNIKKEQWEYDKRVIDQQNNLRKKQEQQSKKIAEELQKAVQQVYGTNNTSKSRKKESSKEGNVISMDPKSPNKLH